MTPGAAAVGFGGRFRGWASAPGVGLGPRDWASACGLGPRAQAQPQPQLATFSGTRTSDARARSLRVVW